MLHLQKLGIRGIRSFDPDEFQEIKFRPLTLILGQNGAGKTTIIESLKFAATGELPPGCDRGKTFVHDIGLTKESTINGQIRLSFKDCEDKNTVITRCIRTSARTVKQKQTVTFKQVNQVILRDGKSVDQKCADINAEAIELFGVSKAVLNNVIFCHQEDTNWPLAEGKALKEKFDTIFGSDEYVKSLEKLKKIRTEMVKGLKFATQETANAKEWMGEAKRIKKELASENARVEDLKTRVKKYKEELKVHKEKLIQLAKKEQLIDEKEKEIMKIESKEKAVKYRIKELEDFKLDEELLDKQVEEIEEQVKSFNHKSDEVNQQKKELERELSELGNKNAQLSKERKTLAQELGKIDELKRQIEIKRHSRNEVFAALKEQDFGGQFDRETLIDKQVLTLEEKSFIQRLIDEEFEHFKKRHSEQKKTLQEELDVLDSGYRKAQNQKSVVGHQIQEKEKLLRSLKTQIEKLEAESEGLEHSNSQEEMQELGDKVKRLKETIDQLESEGQNFKNNRSKFEAEKKNVKNEIVNIGRKISVLEAKIEANNEAFMRKSIDDKIARKETIAQKCFLGLEGMGIDVNDKGLFFPALKAKIDQYQAEVSSSKAAIENCGRKKNEAVKCMDSHYDLMEQLRRVKSSFLGVCDVDEYEKVKDGKETAMKESFARKEYLSTIIPALKKQLDQVKCGGYCPVCENDIEVQWKSKKTGDEMEHSTVVENLSKTIQSHTEELESFSTDSLELEILKLKKLGSSFERYQSLKTQVEESKSRLESEKQKIEEYKKKIQESTETLEKAKESLQKVEAFRFDVQLHDSLVEEIAGLETKFKTLNSAKHMAELQDVKEQMTEKENFLTHVESKIDKFASKLEENSDQKSSTFKEIQELEQRQRELKKSQENHSSYRKFVAEKSELESDLASLKKEMESLTKRLPEEMSKCKALKEKLDKLSFELQNKHLAVKSLLKNFVGYCKEIEECNERLKSVYEKNSKTYIDTLEKDIKQVEDKIPQVEKELRSVKEELESSTPRLEMLMRCRDLLKLRMEHSDFESQIAEIKSQMPSESLAQVRSSNRSLSEARSKTDGKLENAKTQVLECQERVESLKERMEEKKFAEAESNYKKLMAEEVLTKMACDDLNKYYKAMDSSITQFHISKMNEINKLLEKLWKIAYQGKDIEAIKIVSDEEVRSAESARRNYDYRVVMVRGGKELDMRGRCSAGQKVLASLVIRLVLAIIFCHNFNVVTLDEPTTNLDRKNIRAFARAISSLMNSDRFFQIIIITHDREFLDCLDRSMIGEYFEVNKNEKGFSQINMKTNDGEEANLLDTTIVSQMETMKRKQSIDIPLTPANKKVKVEEEEVEHKPEQVKKTSRGRPKRDSQRSSQ